MGLQILSNTLYTCFKYIVEERMPIKHYGWAATGRYVYHQQSIIYTIIQFISFPSRQLLLSYESVVISRALLS